VRGRLAVFGGAHFDATGNGLGLAEHFQEAWGHELVEAVKISVGWYLEAFPRLKRAIEDRAIRLPRDRDIRDDLRAIRLVRGVPSIPDARVKGRHGDAAVALAMLLAALKSDYQAAAYTPVRPAAARRAGEMAMRADEVEDDMRQLPVTAGFGAIRGAW
jgi:phage FluMu gp28-like protein